MKILSVSTSLSEDSTTLKLADKILVATAQAAEKAAPGTGVDTTHVNIRSLATAITDMTLTGFRSEALEEAFAQVAEADVIITVTPVYKSAPVGLHTLFWQLIDDKTLAGTPVLIASTGGTARHSLAAETALRPVLAYLKGIIVPTSVFAATDDWGSAEGGRALNTRIAQAARELVDLSAALSGRGGGLPEADTAVGGVHGVASGGSPAKFGPARRSGIDAEFDPERITPFADLLQG